MKHTYLIQKKFIIVVAQMINLVRGEMTHNIHFLKTE